MVKKIIFWIFVLLLAIILFFSLNAYIRFKPEPSRLEIVSEQQSFKVKPVTYSLQKWGRVSAADTYFDPASSVENDIPIQIKPSVEIALKFDETPDSIKYYLWELQTGRLVYEASADSPMEYLDLNVPYGEYAIEIRAKWKNGYVLYNAKLSVEQ